MSTLEQIVGKDEAKKLRQSWSNRRNRLSPYYLELKGSIETLDKKLKQYPNAYSVHKNDWLQGIELNRRTMRILKELMQEFGIEIPN